MKRQNSEFFYRVRDSFKTSKAKPADLMPSNFLSVKDLRAQSIDKSLASKWNSPLPMKPVLSIFNPKPQDPSQLDLKKLSNPEPDPKQSGYRVKKTEKLRKKSANILDLLLYSTWGESETVGLHQLELFDEKSKQIHLPLSYTSIKYSPEFTDVSLLYRKKSSVKPEPCWQGKFLESKPVCIRIQVPVDYNVCGIRIWNLPKAGDLAKSAKRAELYLNRERVWKGEIKRGENPTEIILLAGFLFTDWKDKIIQVLSASVRIINKPEGNPNPQTGMFRKYSKSDLKIVKEVEEQSESRPMVLEDLMESKAGVKVLKFELLSTWGDLNYIGLFGVEFWDGNGEKIVFTEAKKQVIAEPAGLKVLPEYLDDIRTADKLVDGVYWTCDDSHSWLAPYTPNSPHSLEFTFPKKTEISLIRIWNFNKSRIHSLRGVKSLKIISDSKNSLFSGEISKAPGCMETAEQFCEYLILTKNDETLRKIAQNDWVDKFKEDLPVEFPEIIRPGTASKDLKVFDDGRPMTSILTSPKKTGGLKRVVGKSIRICILASWGDAFYVGLTGIEVLGPNGRIHINRSDLKAQPESLNCIQGHSNDPRTLDKLLNGLNQTTEDVNMWLIPFVKNSEPYLHITLTEKQEICGLKIWNYNKSYEDTSRGAKLIRIFVDDQAVSGEIALRKAPGHNLLDFGQEISIPARPAKLKKNLLIAQEYEGNYILPGTIQGFIITLRILSTWGDYHYVGMNGISFFNTEGQQIQVNSTVSYPELQTDPRVSNNLIDGVNNTISDNHSWLSPFIDTTLHSFSIKSPNFVSFYFDQPEEIGAIQFWNYRKTPNRGVKDFDILIDDVLAYKGVMKAFDESEDWSCFVFFDDELKTMGKEFIYSEPEEKLMFDERKNLKGTERRKDFTIRPTTGIDIIASN